MAKTSLESSFQKILDSADVKINGKRDWDIQVNDSELYRRVLSKGSLGLGEAYMDGLWDCKRLDEFFTRVLKSNLNEKVKGFNFILASIRARLFNLQSKNRAKKVAKEHYDIGNELYKTMLDKRLVYTCGYWKNVKTLDKAQEAKLDLVCKKLGLKKGMKVLDIGCGWGSFAKFAAERYNVKVVGVTISKEQVELARKLCKGFDVEIRLQDYRDVSEKFDRVVSLGMFEHVGYKNYRGYMKIVNNCLNPEGLFLLHTIARDTSVKSSADLLWLSKYIFPNSMLPSAKQITTASEGLFTLQDWQNFAPYYDETLMAWHSNFVKNWSKIKDKFDERFYRMWNYYLLSCAGAFRAGTMNLWQIVFSKGALEEVYEGAR